MASNNTAVEPKRVRVVCLAGTRGSTLYVTGVDDTAKGFKFWYTGDQAKAFRFAQLRADEIAARISAGGRHRAWVAHEDDIQGNAPVLIGRRRRVPRAPLPFFTRGIGGYQPPMVRFGGEQALPETREDVILRMLCALDTQVAYRQDFSNGEFTSQSLIVGKTQVAVSDRKLDLECAGDTVYFDSKLAVYWRQGGCFD